MAKIVVFDSGLGSLSIIHAIQKISKAEIVYFADQQNYPYGHKSHAQLDTIIKKSIKVLQRRFSPNVLVMASNTPSLMLNLPKRVIGVKPPLSEAHRITKSKKIGILGTESAVRSKGLARYIKGEKYLESCEIFKINGSELVDLVESGEFISERQHCKRIIREVLDNIISENFIDTVALSSTHLSFLGSMLKSQFPNVRFIDSGDAVAQKVYAKIRYRQTRRNSLKIFTSGNPADLEKNLNKLGVKNRVSFFSI